MADLNSAKQQADDDLTWLARNVHEWPGGDHQPWCYVTTVDGGIMFASALEFAGKTTSKIDKEDWLTLRAELQNKPSWKGAPEWAEWLAQDGGTGRWWFYSEKPLVAIKTWYADEGRFELSKSGEVLGDWLDTLERRPQASKPEPSSDDWHKRGERPPVGSCVLKKLKSYCDNWREVTIAGAGNQLVILRYPDGVEVVGGWHEYDFRPLKSERERVASELVDVMLAVPVSDRKTASESYMSMALAIYDHLHPESKP